MSVLFGPSGNSHILRIDKSMMSPIELLSVETNFDFVYPCGINLEVRGLPPSMIYYISK